VLLVQATEKSGYRHLELVTVPSFHSTGDAVHHAITSGEWQVDANRIWVDHNAKMVYFVGLADSHLRKQLYSASFDVTKSPNMQRHSFRIHSLLSHIIYFHCERCLQID
jgi:hypothetical protein